MSAALVTGGSQGVGKGIVEGLAEDGRTVFFTGRSSIHLKETEKNASMVGGEIIAKQVDHSNDGEVEDLFREIVGSHKLGLLVNNAWGGYERMIENGEFTWMKPFWEQPMHRWDSMMNNGVRAAFYASKFAAKAMLNQSGGIIINLSYWSAQKHVGNVLYGMAKAATDKMTFDMSAELAGTNITVISLYPGLVRTEKVMESAEMLDLSNSESPRFIGRVVAALYKNQEYAKTNHGKVCVAAELAKDLGIVDIDGKNPLPLSLEDF